MTTQRSEREDRVAAGLVELDRRLCDDVRRGLAAAQQDGAAHWEAMAARMVDAQARGLADRLRGLGAVSQSGTGWEARLVEEYSLIRLLITAYRRRADLPDGLADTVRDRIGFTRRRAEVLEHGARVRDRWHVLGRRDETVDRLRTRRTWLRGSGTGRPALVLSFAVMGESLDDSLLVGTDIDAELAFYPGTPALRALVAETGRAVETTVPQGDTVEALLDGWAAALGADPWLVNWPTVLAATRPCCVGDNWLLSDAAGHAVPIHPGFGGIWELLAVSGGHPATVAGEWTPRGLWPLTVWDGRSAVRL